jgi:hypothetical protein
MEIIEKRISGQPDPGFLDIESRCFAMNDLVLKSHHTSETPGGDRNLAYGRGNWKSDSRCLLSPKESMRQLCVPSPSTKAKYK